MKLELKYIERFHDINEVILIVLRLLLMLSASLIISK